MAEHEFLLSLQGSTGRMVAAMDLAVTIGAIHTDNQSAAIRIGITVIQHSADMGQPSGSRLCSMALLA
jgi:hypothetical protein